MNSVENFNFHLFQQMKHIHSANTTKYIGSIVLRINCESYLVLVSINRIFALFMLNPSYNKQFVLLSRSLFFEAPRNPLLDKNSEGWINCHLLTPLIDDCFLNCEDIQVHRLV